jgi:hypothetical protein
MKRSDPVPSGDDPLESRLRRVPLVAVPSSLRSRVLAGAAASADRSDRSVWWFWMSPRWAWSALGAAWVLVLGFWFSTPRFESAGRPDGGWAVMSPETVEQSRRDREALLASLREADAPPRPEADRPKPAPKGRPGPRSAIVVPQYFG